VLAIRKGGLRGAGRRGEEDTVEVFAVSETRCIGMLLWEKAIEAWA